MPLFRRFRRQRVIPSEVRHALSQGGFEDAQGHVVLGFDNIQV